MSKKILWLLLLIVLMAVVLIFNARGSVKVVLFPGLAFSLIKSVAFLIFMGVGVVMGILLR